MHRASDILLAGAMDISVKLLASAVVDNEGR